MKFLIIAEKPSLALNVIQAINKREKFERKEGYYESKNYIVSWAVGHLLQLKDISDYEGEKVKWKDIKLPYIPSKFEFKIKQNTKAQYKILEKLIKRKDVSAIYNCGDPDREGEVIIRLILNAAGNKKTVYRLWLQDQEADTILESLDKKEPDSLYNNLYQEGLSRTIMDWILGINETIYLSVKTNTLLRAGRIIVPIVKKIYDRDMEIKNFIPEKYYQAESFVTGLKLTVKDKYKTMQEAEEKAQELNAKNTVVSDIKSTEIKKQPPKLFSLTSLQKFLNKNYKMSADEVLKIVQKLYENKYVTYPRTDSEYMTDEEKGKAKKIIKSMQDSNLVFRDSKSIFNTEKVEAHSAITPTSTIPEELTEKEEIVYKIISNRFKANFTKDECIVAATEVKIKNGEEIFILNGKSIKEKGYLIYENNMKEATIPQFNIGDVVKTKFSTIEKETQPPKKMTEASLLSFLEHPFSSSSEVDDEIEIKEIGLGTPATRASIIANAIKMKYILVKNNNLSIGELGVVLIETLNKLNANLYADKTISFSKDLRAVNQGKLTIDQCIKNTEKEIKEVIKAGENISIKVDKNEEKEVIGICPRCGGYVYENSKTFYCSETKCNFAIWKEDKFFKEKGKKVTKTMAKKFLDGKEVLVKNLISKEKKKYDAKISMNDTGKYVNFKLIFKNK